MMTDMPLMTIKECLVDADNPPAPLDVLVEEFPRGRRVRLAGPDFAWVLVLPTDGFEFDVMQYQISADNSSRSAVLELKLNGAAYRTAVTSVREGASVSVVLQALRVLLAPVLPLVGLVDDHLGSRSQRTAPALCAVTG